MTARFTIGIEEEFQTVDQATGQLCAHIQQILEKGSPFFGEQIKAEMLQPTVELISGILPDVSSARHELRLSRAKLAQLVGEEGLALISAGTHPGALWQDQVRSPYERYAQLEEEFQDVARMILIFGLHVHIGVQNQEIAVTLMESVAYLASSPACHLDQLAVLGRTPDRPQIVSLGGVETVPSQWHPRGLSLVVRLS